MIISATDKWLVLSPKRTGSKLITDFICNVYECNLTPIPFIGPMDHDYINKDFFIKHSHSLEDYFKLKNDPSVRIIISTRDMVESSLSWCIAIRNFGKFHCYDKNNKLIIKKFKLDPSEFLYTYNQTKDFYNLTYFFDLGCTLPFSPVGGITTYIDYDEFKNNSKKLFKKLNLQKYSKTTSLKLPIKNDPHKDWIDNWKEISLLTKSLDKKPILYQIG